MIFGPGHYDGAGQFGGNNMWQTFLSSLASGAGSGLAGGIMGKLFGSGKERIPSGYQMGQRQADYFQALYKGQLNPWELAGAGGQGEGGAAAPLMAGMQQRKTQDSNLKNMLALESAKIAKDVQVAKIHADATKAAAGIQPESRSRQENLMSDMQEAINQYKDTIAKGKRDESQFGHTKPLKTIYDNIQSWYEWLKDGNILSDEQRQSISDKIYEFKTKMDKIQRPVDKYSKQSKSPVQGNINLSISPDVDQRKFDPKHNTGKFYRKWRWSDKTNDKLFNKTIQHYQRGYNKKLWRNKKKK